MLGKSATDLLKALNQIQQVQKQLQEMDGQLKEINSVTGTLGFQLFHMGTVNSIGGHLDRFPFKK
ncbi:MAG: hypothetical protein WD907_06675 [Bacilli bacterium]